MKLAAMVSILLLFCGCASQAQDDQSLAPSQGSAVKQSPEGAPIASPPQNSVLSNADCDAMNSQLRQGCYYKMILGAGNPELCEKMPLAYPEQDPVLNSIYCYRYYWLAKNDSGLCGTFKSQDARFNCFKDFDMCESMQKEAGSLSGADLEYAQPFIDSCYKIRKAKEEAASKAK